MRTLGSSYLALQLQAQGGGASSSTGSLVIEILAQQTSYVARGVLLILALLSIGSWAVILYKLVTLSRAQRQSASFLEVFRRSNKFSEVQAVCRSLSASPLVGLFQAGYAELTAQLRQGSHAEDAAAANPRASAARPILRSITSIDRALMRASVVEMNKLEDRITFLATTASVAPFVGLFGTVWGIMVAFLGIAETGSTNLGAVAPGIADALITTAAGLFAAIPAVFAYNHLTQRVKVFAGHMDDFAMEFLNIAERNFT